MKEIESLIDALRKSGKSKVAAKVATALLKAAANPMSDMIARFMYENFVDPKSMSRDPMAPESVEDLVQLTYEEPARVSEYFDGVLERLDMLLEKSDWLADQPIDVRKEMLMSAMYEYKDEVINDTSWDRETKKWLALAMKLFFHHVATSIDEPWAEGFGDLFHSGKSKYFEDVPEAQEDFGKQIDERGSVAVAPPERRPITVPGLNRPEDDWD